MNKDDVIGKLKIEHDVTVEFVNDIMCTAFDGGVGGCWYWIEDYCAFLGVASGRRGEDLGIDYFHDCLPLGGKIRIKPSDDDAVYVLTLDNFLDGLQLYVQQKGFNGLQDDHDADDADQIIQYALFKEVVYG